MFNIILYARKLTEKLKTLVRFSNIILKHALKYYAKYWKILQW